MATPSSSPKDLADLQALSSTQIVEKMILHLTPSKSSTPDLEQDVQHLKTFMEHILRKKEEEVKEECSKQLERNLQEFKEQQTRIQSLEGELHASVQEIVEEHRRRREILGDERVDPIVDAQRVVPMRRDRHAEPRRPALPPRGGTWGPGRAAARPAVGPPCGNHVSKKCFFSSHKLGGGGGGQTSCGNFHNF